MSAGATFGQQMSATDTHSKYILAVDEYVPAPGQFVNTMPKYEEGDDAASMAAKCTEALADNKRSLVTLGGYGGYITFHFDHSIANIAGRRDFYIAGNAMKGGAEPGVVMVSKDINRNGLPDDPWYELAGSADVDSVGKVGYGYTITYEENPLGDIPWTDNRGNSGSVARNSFHSQEYFPQWIEGPMSFSGTLLPANGYNNGTAGRENWVRDTFRFGYADNALNTDSAGCSFDIAWAVDQDRTPVELDFIDFVRVYTGVNQQCGWTGETSTEIAGAEDLHLEESIEAILAAPSAPATFEDVALGETGVWNGSDMTGENPIYGYFSQDPEDASQYRYTIDITDYYITMVESLVAPLNQSLELIIGLPGTLFYNNIDKTRIINGVNSQSFQRAVFSELPTLNIYYTEYK